MSGRTSSPDCTKGQVSRLQVGACLKCLAFPYYAPRYTPGGKDNTISAPTAQGQILTHFSPRKYWSKLPCMCLCGVSDFPSQYVRAVGIATLSQGGGISCGRRIFHASSGG